MTTFTTGAALIIGAAACVTDLHSRRIPNWLTFGAAAAALAFHFADGGQAGAQHATARVGRPDSFCSCRSSCSAAWAPAT